MGSCTRLIVSFSVLLAGCKKSSDFYPMPVQQTIPPPIEVAPVTMVNLSDADVSRYIVRDVVDGTVANSWRWSNDRPEFKFQLEKQKSYTACMEFTVTDTTFKTTGPVTMEFSVNERSLKKLTYTKPGTYIFEEPVPPDWTQTDTTTLAAKITPVWVSPEDGAHLGVLLIRAGFARK